MCGGDGDADSPPVRAHTHPVAPSQIAVVAVITRASAYGIFKPAFDSLYTRVDAETRYKTKNFIDTAVWRFGDLAITSTFNALRALGATLPGFAAAAMLAASCSGWIGWKAARTLEKPPKAP